MRIGRSAKGPAGRNVERKGAAAIEGGDEHADGVGRRGAHELGCRRGPRGWATGCEGNPIGPHLEFVFTAVV